MSAEDSDSTATVADRPQANRDADVTATDELVITAQFLKDLSFENPSAPEVLARIREKPEMEVNVDVAARPLAQNTYEVALSINAKAMFGSTIGFIAELHYGSVCLAPELPDEVLQRKLLVEGPALLFPFARAILAEATRDGGFPPLYITPINFAKLYETQRRSPAENANSESAPVSGATESP